MKNNTIGKRIAEARINRNITQEHLEELSGLSVSTISRIETGKYMPTIEISLSFLKFLMWDLTIFFMICFLIIKIFKARLFRMRFQS